VLSAIANEASRSHSLNVDGGKSRHGGLVTL
jgi:hypothetical protein